MTEAVKVTTICFPPGLILKKSTCIPGETLGVFTTAQIPIGQIFGPYKGKTIPLQEITADMDFSYMWEIVQNGQFTHAIDGREEWNSNWLRFVNLAPSRSLQTLHAVLHSGEIFFITVRPIPANTELLVWYGNTYSQQLGIFNYEGDSLKSTGDITFKCKECLRAFKYPKFLALHRMYYCEEHPDESPGKLGDVDENANGLEENHARGEDEEEEEVDEDEEDEEEKGESEEMNGHYDSEKTTKEVETNETPPKTQKPFKCEVCGKHFMFSGDLSKHSRIHSGARPFACQFCGKAYRQNAHLRRHIAQVHQGENSYSCEQCGKMFTDIDVYSKHLLTHVCQRPYICPKCGKVFRNNYNFIRHTGMKPYKCPLCARTFGHASVLSSHVRTHNGDRPFACTICGKTYAQSSTLYAHKRTHEVQNKLFKCDTCDKRFMTKSLLHRHLGTHMRNSQLRHCDVCGKVFRKAGSLTLHLRVHRNDYPFSCEKCGSSFKEINYLNRHLKRHEKELAETMATASVERANESEEQTPPERVSYNTGSPR